ncbi:PAS domain S-box-containing protein [Haladaptatus litoreus]|uniref:PAS domain S-box-containing protein n=1 Tax=Haladaptatus litoreus TaxID=553468 RepID=A0A1N6Y9E2_9EURY|nr:bacterio-opsin activator domain-containing protein [Haladaptatus litoreus]SIR11089.1 PAS domain S-box-containing protein [Haladaptatus litoreus]
MGKGKDTASHTDIDRLALDALPMNVAVLDEHGIVVATNRTWEEFGRKNDLSMTTLGSSYLDVCDAADEPTADETAKGIREILAGERTEFSLEYPCHSPTERRWFLMSATKTKTGDKPYVVVAHLNITNRKEREFQVERYQTIIQNAPLVLFVFDKDGTVMLSEGRGLDALGVADGEIVGESMFDRHDELSDIANDVTRALSGERVHATREYEGLVFESAYQPVLDDFGNVERVVGVAIDVTKRERHEQVLAALSDLTRVLLETETTDEVCEIAIDGAKDVLDLPETLIALYDEDERTLRVRAGELRDGTIADLLDIESHDGLAWQSFIENEPKSENGVAVLPLGNHGVFVTKTEDESGFDVAELCSAAVESALGRADRERTLREQEATLRRQNAALERLNELNEGIRRIDRALVEARSRDEIERAVCTRLASGGPYRFAWVGENDPGTKTVVPRESAGIGRGFLDAVTVSPDNVAATDPTGIAVRTGRAQVVQDVLRDPPSEPWRREALKRGYRSACALPLRYKDAVYGVLTVYSDRQGTFDELERAVLVDVSQTVAYAINAVESKKALVGGEVVELRFDVVDSSIVFVAIERETGGRVEFMGVVSEPDGTLKTFFTVRDATVEDVQAVAAHSLEITDIQHVSYRNSNALFSAALTDSSFIGTLLNHGAVPETFIVDDLPAQVVVRLPANADIRTFVEVLQRRFPDIELRSRRQREGGLTTGDFDVALTETLTDRQRETLETAYYSGFFDSPRKSTGEEVGRSLGISQPTFQHHLRAAERKLLSRLLESGV